MCQLPSQVYLMTTRHQKAYNQASDYDDDDDDDDQDDDGDSVDDDD